MTHPNAIRSRLQRARELADKAEGMKGGEMAQTAAALSTMHIDTTHPAPTLPNLAQRRAMGDP